MSASVAKWNGRSWSDMDGGVDGNVRDMVVWDDGTGAALYVGGYFDYAGSVAASRVARWDGAAWHPLGGGLYSTSGSGVVHELEVFDDGRGESLYAAGTFTGAVGAPGAARLARWDGAQWFAVAPTTGNAVVGLYAFDDGVRGPGLIVGGNFNAIGGISAHGIARYDRSGWSTLGGVQGWYADAMGRFDEGSTPTLWVRGQLYTPTGQSTALGRYQYVCEPCYPDCNADGLLTVADFGCFQTKFVAQDPYTDCNADTFLTVQDFGCFKTKFVVGCP